MGRRILPGTNRQLLNVMKLLMDLSQVAKTPAAGETGAVRRHYWPSGLWPLPAIVLAFLLGLTLFLWYAQSQASRAGAPALPGWVLGGGTFVSLAMAAAVYFSLLHRARAQEQSQRHLAAIESLHSITAAISAQLGSGAGVLDQLAESARGLLGMSRAMIGLLDERKRKLEIIASAGGLPPNCPKVFKLQDLPMCRECLQTGHVRFEPDLNRATREYGLEAARLFGAAALILIPLQVQGRRIGILALNDSRPRTFTAFDHRLGELLASQASVILYNSQLYERMRSALEARTRLLMQRRALTAVNAAIQSPATLEGSLQQITRLLPPVLGADLCGMFLVTGSEDELSLVAATPPFDAMAGDGVSGPHPLAREMFRTRRPIVIEDARLGAPGLHRAWGSLTHVGSILGVPMFGADDRPLGALVLLRHTTGSFSVEQVELAQSFSTLAAVSVLNARLLEQTRRDADAKTVLLRELNHRVKNNLAGIVALLSMSPPAMPPDVRGWLDRATDRIRAMAAAHELFTGDVERVSLEALVGQTINSLSIAKPMGVEVKTDLDGVGLSLETGRAVGLAMVLHELCYNALVHGVRDGGTLTIRARASSNGVVAADSDRQLRIEVIDNGRRPSAPSEPQTDRAGQGLDLVRGLVSRELRGTFSLQARPEGGTVAAVEFPAGPQADERVAS